MKRLGALCLSQRTGRLLRGAFTTSQVCLFCLLVLTVRARAQISVSGVQDRQIYTDSVSFTVASEAGYDYTVELNGDAVATDVSIEVDQPDYYELRVHRREVGTGAEEELLVRFIVRASERGDSEWGLPPWRPYPPIPSATGEFAGGRLEIVAPAGYPTGLEIPVVARVEDGSGRRLGVNGMVAADGFQEYPLQLLRGVGHVFLPAAGEAQTILYSGRIQSLETHRQIVIEAETTWQVVSDDIIASVEWGANSRIHITGVSGGALTIAPGATLTIGPGSVVMVDPDLEIAVEGRIVVNGTTQRPVVFTTQDRNVPWGGFLFESAAAEGDFTGTILTASGADSNWFGNNSGKGSSHRREQCLFYISNGAHVNLTDCYLVDNHGQAGHGEDAYLTMTGCLVQKCITAGQYNGGAIVLVDCALIEFPAYDAPFADNDNDALYLTGGAHTLTDCLVGWALDDGVDAGSGSAGSVAVDGCWFEACYHEGMAWSRDRDADVTDTVVLNCGQGIECGHGDPDVHVAHCLSTANLVGARFGENYPWSFDGVLTVTDSLLLFNRRDVWGRAWDNWEVHLSQMDIQNNFLSIPNANFPDNRQWDPVGGPNQVRLLAPFLAAPAETAGSGLAVRRQVFDLSELAGGIAVGLSSFSTNPVSVDYTIDTDRGLYDSGSLLFVPGQTLKHIEFVPPPMENLREVRITLADPVNAEITGLRQVTYIRPYEISKSLIVAGDQWRYFKGNVEPPANWNELSFDDSQAAGWLDGTTPIGYENSSGYEDVIATDLPDMRDNYWSVYARRLFFVADPSRLSELVFSMDVDDGYIAYINGVLVHSLNPPTPPAHDSRASGSHEACGGTSSSSGPCPPEQVDVRGYVAAGWNVLAVQAHNRTLDSSDFLFIPELTAVFTPYPGDFEPDGDVDFDDFARLAAAWASHAGAPGYNWSCDISTPVDGSVDVSDLLVLVENWLGQL